MSSFSVREVFTREIGWFIPTAEYLDALARVVQTRKVVEVCAGTGLFGKLMRGRGANWISTDLEPWPNSEDVSKFDALEAVRALNPDIVFAGWIPYGSTLDYELARLGHPCIYVGEGWGGCTGSEKFWERQGKDGYRIKDSELCPDVSQWIGIHDRTYYTAPETGFTSHRIA